MNNVEEPRPTETLDCLYGDVGCISLILICARLSVSPFKFPG